ncbi:MAG: hypothetical protein CVU89_15645 [Firmicutes bacterium HGW-Firmicutes-14]|nr:MAG: hypothetical protein CVU89_15645 [Firmicutes bacterium HGW-Firmicutes-14]
MPLKKYLILILLVSIFMPGCWDIEEVNNRSSVGVLFLDTGSQQKVKLGAVFPVPGTLLPPVVGMEQQFEKRHIVLTAEGSDITDAWSNLASAVSRTIFFGQLRVIIISDEYARMNIDNFLDFTGRMPNMPMNIPLLVTKSDPEKLMEIKNNTNFVPGNFIGLYLQSPRKKPLAMPGVLWEVFADLDNKTSDPFMPMIEEYQKNYRIAGLAVFSGPRMVGEINMKETETAALIRDVPFGFLTAPLGDNEGLISYRDIRSRTKIIPEIDNKGVLTFTVRTDVTGKVSELNPTKKEITLQEKKQFETKTAELIRKDINGLLQKLQQLNSDPLGFGEKFRAAYPLIWEKINWHDVYPAARFEVKANFKIVQTGMYR